MTAKVETPTTDVPTKLLTYAAENLKNFRLDAFSGPSEIIGWEKNEVRIEIRVTIRRWSTLFLVEEPLSELDWDDDTLEVFRNDETLSLNSKPNYGSWTNWLNFPKVAFKIYLPEVINTHIHHLFGGDITLQNLNGRHQLNTMGGNIRLESIVGEIRGKTMGGNINVLACDAVADVSTFGGNVFIEHCKGEVKVSTKGGNIKIQRCNGKIYTDTWGGSIKAYDCAGDLKCYTSGGNISFEGIQGNLGASTKGGNIKATVKAINDYFWLETSGGNIRVSLPLNQGMQLDVKGSSIKTPPLPGFVGKKKTHRLSGQLNGGGASVNLKTQGGNITISQYEEKKNEDDFVEEPRPRIPIPSIKNWNWQTTTIPTLFYSFFILIVFVYGLNSVFYFSLELMNPDSSENAQNTALFLVNISTGFACFISITVFTTFIEKRLHHKWQKNVALILLTYICVRLIHLFQWHFYVYFPDNQAFWPHYWRILDYNVRNIYNSNSSLLFAFIPLIAVSAYYYFWEKSRHFTRKISEQEYQLLNLEKLKTKAQLNALEARINPHFLYNSLNSIAGLVHQDPDKAEEMTIQLSKLFRYTTGRNEGHCHSVAEELEVVKSYLAIEQMRFGARLQFTIEVGPNLMEVKIPRFLLQPIVENAIKHGISQMLENGKIEIKIEQKEDTVQFVIHDNGPAFKEDVGGGYGLRSIRDKLNLFYGEKASLQVQNNDYKAVLISIPMSYDLIEFT